MATGYTHPVAEGTVTDFATFALDCARAFGALIMMRDHPVGAPIPDEFTPSTWHAESKATAEARLAELMALTPEERAGQAAQAYVQAVQEWERSEAERHAKRARYDAMLAAARAWQPPTPEHVELGKFMVNQLEESIKWDCDGWEQFAPVLESADDWFSEQVRKARRDIEYHGEQDAAEVERCRARSEWVRALRASLPTERRISGAAR